MSLNNYSRSTYMRMEFFLNGSGENMYLFCTRPNDKP